MTISPLIFLVIYGVLLLVFLFLAIANFYNVIRFSFLKGPVIIVSIVFVCLMVGVVLGTLRLLHRVDWQQPTEVTIPFISSPTDEEPQ